MADMQHRLFRFHALVFTGRGLWTEEILALLLAISLFVMPAAASTRFLDRSLYINSAVPGATTSYTVSFGYASPVAVGSVDMLFCIDPIPYMPCVAPPGLDVSNATLSSQIGETGFSIDPGSHTANHIMLTRSPAAVPTASGLSSYKFDGVINPTDTNQAFSIRLRSHEAPDATGPLIDFGSVRSQVTDSIMLETQVPPMLIFCLAQEVDYNCTGTNDNYFTDMGQLSPSSTLTAQSQMAVGTNASGGFAITTAGGPPAAGTNVIDGSSVPTESEQGTNQFGINLVANNSPTIGNDPEGVWANAVPSVDYSQPNKYKYIPGDVIAYSPNVSLMKKFTVSYILNSSKGLHPGVYSTTITYIASGRF